MTTSKAVSAWVLAALVTAPVADAGAPTVECLTWDGLRLVKPGEMVVLVLDDGARVGGRLLEAGAREAAVVDFSGSATSAKAQKRLVRELLAAAKAGEDTRPRPAASRQREACAPIGLDYAPVVRRVAREQVTSAYLVRPEQDGIGGLLKMVGALSLLFIVGLKVGAIPTD